MKTVQKTSQWKLAFAAHELDAILLEAVTGNDQAYRKAVRLVVSVLSYGGHYSHAVPVGMEAIRRGDKETLQQLVDATHDDTGLIEALQAATGKKLAYLAYEF